MPLNDFLSRDIILNMRQIFIGSLGIYLRLFLDTFHHDELKSRHP
jgi:hypothetical protein